MPQMPVVHGGIGFGQTFATSTYGTTLTAGAANVKGAVVELIAATPFDAHWIEVMAGNPSTATAFAIDILIGASTEAALIPDLSFHGRATGDGGGRWLFPVFIPKGSRISARVGSFTADVTCMVAVNLFNAGITANGLATAVTQYGTITNSRGPNLDPGAVAHTDVTVEMTAATVCDHHWIVLSVGNADIAYAGVTKFLIDVCIGASTETTILSDWPIGGAGTADVARPDLVCHIPAFVPKGSRLTVRARCSSTTDSDRDLYVILHCA